MKIRLAASAGILVVALAADLLLARMLWRDYGDVQLQVERDAQAAAENVAYLLDQVLGRVTESLTAVGDVLRVHPDGFRSGDPMLQSILEHRVRDLPILRNLFVVGIDGLVLSSASPDPAARRIAEDVAAHGAFSVLWLSPRGAESRVLADIGPFLDPAAVPVALPVVGAAGAVIAVVVAEVAPTTLAIGAQTGVLADVATIAITDGAGRMLICARAGPGGCREERVMDPAAVAAASATTEMGLTAVVDIPTGERRARWLRFAAGIGGGALALTVASPVLGWFLVAEVQRRRRARQYLVAENERLSRDYATVAAELDHREARMRVLIDRIHDAILVVDRDGRIEEANSASLRLLCSSGGMLIGTQLSACLPGLEVPDEIDGVEDALVQELVVEREDAAASILEVTFSRDCDLNLPHVLVIIRDITEQKKSEDRLRRQATVDGLTGLLNRAAFMEAAGSALAERRSAPFTIAMIDADHFKSVNDTYGHQAGDEVLRALAQIIRGAVRADDLVGRFGGEEFIVAMPGMTEMGATRFAERLLGATRRAAVAVEGASLSFTVSVGWALKPAAQAVDLEKLIGVADDHLYQAKAQGRDRSRGSRINVSVAHAHAEGLGSG